MPSEPGLEKGQSCLQSKHVKWRGSKEKFCHRNMKPVSRAVGPVIISVKGACLGGVSLPTERSKASFLIFSLLMSKGSGHVMNYAGSVCPRKTGMFWELVHPNSSQWPGNAFSRAGLAGPGMTWFHQDGHEGARVERLGENWQLSVVSEHMQ